MNKDPNFPKRVQDSIDFIYSLTKDNVFKESWKTFNNRLLDECVAELVKLGALQKTKYWIDGSPGRRFMFKWNSTMAPTKVLYKNVLDRIREQHRKKNDKFRNRSKQETLEQSIEISTNTTMDHTVEKTEEKHVVKTCSLEDFTAQQLWQELKERGYVIEDGRIVRKEYLE